MLVTYYTLTKLSQYVTFSTCLRFCFPRLLASAIFLSKLTIEKPKWTDESVESRSFVPHIIWFLFFQFINKVGWPENIAGTSKILSLTLVALLMSSVDFNRYKLRFTMRYFSRNCIRPVTAVSCFVSYRYIDTNNEDAALFVTSGMASTSSLILKA